MHARQPVRQRRQQPARRCRTAQAAPCGGGCLNCRTDADFAPNHNAYRRYGAMVNAASKASWGFEDRDACIRIPESDPRNLRIEHRLAGADANPYLVLAAILTGMEYGLERGVEPIAPLNNDRQSGIDFSQGPAQRLGRHASSPGAGTRPGQRVRDGLLRKQVPGATGLHAPHRCPRVSLVPVAPAVRPHPCQPKPRNTHCRRTLCHVCP